MLKNSSWSLQGLNFSSPCLTIPKEGVVPFHEAGLVRTITLYLHNKKNLKNAYPWEEDQVGKEKKKKKKGIFETRNKHSDILSTRIDSPLTIT